jgi:hypothetical protein
MMISVSHLIPQDRFEASKASEQQDCDILDYLWKVAGLSYTKDCEGMVSK